MWWGILDRMRKRLLGESCKQVKNTNNEALSYAGI
jgi:hypothetical protein